MTYMQFKEQPSKFTSANLLNTTTERILEQLKTWLILVFERYDAMPFIAITTRIYKLIYIYICTGMEWNENHFLHTMSYMIIRISSAPIYSMYF